MEVFLWPVDPQFVAIDSLKRNLKASLLEDSLLILRLSCRLAAMREARTLNRTSYFIPEFRILDFKFQIVGSRS
jgi:hypothetical protein